MLPTLAGAETTPDPFGGLLSHPPFGAAPANGVPAAAAGESIEFRSVVMEDGRNLFSLHDPVARRSVWVALNEPAKGFSVQEYDARRERLTLTYQGRALTLPLKRAVVLAQAVPVIASPAAVAAAGKADSASAVPRKSQAELVREEIARRRTQRGLPPIKNTAVPTRS